ncbi:TonB-dependent receptor [Persicobacter sp. CCB-QB2]|uniref:TonB-dependent receptor n=1 Tax=Persicobacter sp. CCB-QB2 TaxID=1561025 RepID=UPI00092F47B4|nr:TonB-dependent receptor [Persicobacter sp. CCB-QB2]
MHKNLYALVALMLTFVLSTNQLYAQNTTASLSGMITDNTGDALPGATVIAVHTPSGTNYGSTTMLDGKFTIRGMRVGGPYQVTVSFVGYHDQAVENIYLQLGETQKISVKLQESTINLEGVEITANLNSDINGERTGAATSISSEQLKGLPTISRSASDFTRLTPQSNGNSFGGRNNLYNNFSLDGSVFNNSFGLDVATPGGQAGAQPVSLDAIEQVQVSLAPFDVREGGFTGAGVNAVTKSGTNEFHGTVYGFGRNQNMIGSKVSGAEIPNLDYQNYQTGFSLGGPIVKNKLFFFVNAEMERATELAHGYRAARAGETVGGNIASVDFDDAMAVKDHFMSEWGYDAGDFEGYNHEKSNNKILVKLDWNINDQNNFSIRYNRLRAWKDILPHPEAIGGRGPQPYRLPFSNSSYVINNNIDSWVAELNSRFGSHASNKMQIGYSRFRDYREPWSAPFPVIDILNDAGQVALTAGSEMFSTNNMLDQDIFQFRNDFTYYLDKHTLTVGTNTEVFYFNNSFNLFYYPWYTFGSVEEFLNTTKADMDFNQDVVNSQQNDYAMAEVDVAQTAFYIQDEWQAADNFKLTAGLRVDIPIYLSSIDYDPATAEFDGFVDTDGNPVTVDPSKFPKSSPMWSPRVGFNWDVKNDQKHQVRGGTGVFTGRIPFVWLGNQASNPSIQPGYTFQVNATAEDFKFPQVWKTNIAYDMNFGQGWFASVEGIYSKDINAVVHRNYNMRKPTGTLNGTGAPVFQGDEANIYSPAVGYETFLDAGAIVLENVDKGHQYSLTGTVKKAFLSGLNVMAAYTYMESKDYTSIPAEIAADAFQRNPIVGDPNQSQFAHSRYGLQHRIITSVNYRKEYGGGKWATNIALFGEIAKGNRYSYTYAGDANLDNINFNDLIYVPASAEEINLVEKNGVSAGEQWEALDAFIAQDDYLSSRRGQYAERHGAILPWYAQFDLKILQDFNFEISGRKNTLQLSLDILNVGNMLNSNWGVRQLPTNINPISVEGVEANGDGTFDASYSFNPGLEQSFNDDVSLLSKWQAQVGLRWIF